MFDYQLGKAHKKDCFLSFFGRGVDLDPTKHKCCAWTKHTVFGWSNTPYTEAQRDNIGFCGVKLSEVSGTFDERFTRGEKNEDFRGMNAFCCAEAPELHNCDFQYYGSGVAWEDYVDFFHNEQLWLKYFAKAWHMASENG